MFLVSIESCSELLFWHKKKINTEIQKAFHSAIEFKINGEYSDNPITDITMFHCVDKILNVQLNNH